MKYIITLIILSLINVTPFINGESSGETNTRQFINVFPYLDECDQVPMGIGYTFLANTCLNDIGSFINLDEEYDYQSWTFNITQILNSTQTIIVAFKYLQQNCSDEYDEQIEFSIGSEICQSQVPMIAQFNGSVKGYAGITPFSTVTVTKEPQYPDFSQIYAVYENSDESSSHKEPVCSVDNFLFATTISNNLVIDYLSPSNTSQSFTCTDGPSVNICDTTLSPPICKTISVKQKCGTSNQYPTDYLSFTQCSH